MMVMMDMMAEDIGKGDDTGVYVQRGFVVKQERNAFDDEKIDIEEGMYSECVKDDANEADEHIAAQTSLLKPLSMERVQTKQTGILASSLKLSGSMMNTGMSPSGLATSQGDVALADHSHLTPGVKRMMRSVVRGLKAYQEPEAAMEGLGGTYFFKSEAGVKIAIMKPCDEEPLAPNNPKGFVGRQLGEPGLKPTVRVGEAASREVAAYLLDHERFAKVPHTVMVRMSHPIFHQNGDALERMQIPSIPTPEGTSMLAPSSCNDTNMTTKKREAGSDEDETGVWDDPHELPLKLGSLQGFVPHECDTSEVGTSRFNKKDVHRIGILDIRLFNTDRHAGNILVRRVHSSVPKLDGQDPVLHEEYELIPIDHGFALPEGLEPPYFEWQHWPQAMMPFEEEELEYISGLDAKADCELLRRELPGLHETSLRVMELATQVLKQCAAAGLTLAEIAGIMTRPMIGIDDEPSELEKICFGIRREMFEEACLVRQKELDIMRRLQDGMSSMSISDVAEGSDTPGSDSGSGTNFQLSMDNNGSETSKINGILDDVLFSMDEDGGGVRTPAPSSPANVRQARAFAAAPSLRVGHGGEVKTPFGNEAGTTFKEAISNVDSLPLSYDSDSPRHGSEDKAKHHMEMKPDNMDLKDFRGAQSYVPAFATTIKYRIESGPVSRIMSRGDIRELQRPMDEGSRGDAGVKMYPPLVEPRGCQESSQVLNDMSAKEWEAFLSRAEKKIEEGLEAGKWRESIICRGGIQQMSCPRF